MSWLLWDDPIRAPLPSYLTRRNEGRQAFRQALPLMDAKSCGGR